MPPLYRCHKQRCDPTKSQATMQAHTKNCTLELSEEKAGRGCMWDAFALLARMGNLRLLLNTRCSKAWVLFSTTTRGRWKGSCHNLSPVITAESERCCSMHPCDCHQGCRKIRAVLKHPLPRQTHATTAEWALGSSVLLPPQHFDPTTAQATMQARAKSCIRLWISRWW